MDLHEVDGVALREAWIDLLSRYPWQAFYTQTYVEPVRYPRLAMDRLAFILKRVAQHYGVRVFAFVAAEEHKLGTFHAHAVFLTEPEHFRRLPRSLVWTWKQGFRRYGLCRVEDIERVGGVVGYVSKYLTKRPVDYDFYRIAPGP